MKITQLVPVKNLAQGLVCGESMKEIREVEEHTLGLMAASLGPSALGSHRKATWVANAGHPVSCGALWWAERGLHAKSGVGRSQVRGRHGVWG